MQWTPRRETAVAVDRMTAAPPPPGPEYGSQAAPPLAPPPSATPRGGGAGGPPAEWTATFDPASGCTYYTNAATGETSWDPAVLMGPQQTGFGAAPLWRDARPADPTLRYG